MRVGRTSLRPSHSAVERAALWALYGFTAVTLLGFATFGRHPELLARVPQAAGVYGLAFRFFAVGHVWLAAGVMGLFLARRAGGRWLPAFAALYLLSLGSELLGTSYGIPFGAYRYSPLLDPMWLGLVPVVIPLSWFFMTLPSYALARAVLPGRERRAQRVLLTSAILLGWDLSLDPAMSHATAYWQWDRSGWYYGMPWSNLLGWYLTGLALGGALEWLRADRWVERLPERWLAGFYLANLLLPLGMNAAAGLWGAVLTALVVLGATVLLLRRLARAPAPPVVALGAPGPDLAGRR